jgi:hypothetical protein
MQLLVLHFLKIQIPIGILNVQVQKLSKLNRRKFGFSADYQSELEVYIG